MEEKIVEKYLYVVEQIKDADRSRITESDFKKIVEDTGLTQKELAIVKEECDRLSKQAETYVNSNNYAKSAQLLDRALALDPYNVKNIYLATRANIFLYTKHYEEEYYLRINELTTHGLQLAPTQTYFAQAETLVTELHPIGPKEKFWFKLFSTTIIATIGLGIYALIRLFMYNFSALPSEMMAEVIIWFVFAGLSLLFFSVTGIMWLINFFKTNTVELQLKGLTYNDGTSRNFIDRIADIAKGLGLFK